MSRTRSYDYPKLTKRGVALGLALLAIGLGTEFVAHAIHYELPGWETTLLFDVSILGLLVFVFSPIVFGVLLPLTE